MGAYGQGGYGNMHYGQDTVPTKRTLTFGWDLNGETAMITPKVPTVTEISQRPQKPVVERLEKRGER